MRYDSPIPARAIRERPASECESGRDGGSGEEALAFRIPTPNPNPGPMSVLRFDNVSKQYPGGQVALSDVSFDVGAGEMLLVTGHYGPGKSTMPKLIHLSR